MLKLFSNRHRLESRAVPARQPREQIFNYPCTLRFEQVTPSPESYVSGILSLYLYLNSTLAMEDSYDASKAPSIAHNALGSVGLIKDVLCTVHVPGVKVATRQQRVPDSLGFPRKRLRQLL